jgi:uncharacterized protein (TIGR03382 family)
MSTRNESAIVALAVGALAAPTLACVVPPVEPPPTFWIDRLGDTDGDGGFNTLVAQEIGLFSFDNLTNCSCGLGIVGGLPIGGEIDSVSVEIWNKATGERRVVSEFGFDRSPDADPVYENFRAGTGETWIGFWGAIPVLGADADLKDGEIYKIVFDIDTLVGFKRALFVAGGEGTPDGLPVAPGLPHGAEFFAPRDNLPFVPSPGSMAVLGLAGAGLLRRRR